MCIPPKWQFNPVCHVPPFAFLCLNCRPCGRASIFHLRTQERQSKLACLSCLHVISQACMSPCPKWLESPKLGFKSCSRTLHACFVQEKPPKGGPGVGCKLKCHISGWHPFQTRRRLPRVHGQYIYMGFSVSGGGWQAGTLTYQGFPGD